MNAAFLDNWEPWPDDIESWLRDNGIDSAKPWTKTKDAKNWWWFSGEPLDANEI
jgi:hypothetical protein